MCTQWPGKAGIVRRLLVVIAPLLLIACNAGSSFGGPCGGGQFASARAVLPDSGINAADTLLAIFIQHDTEELAELVVWHLRSAGSAVPDPEPDPRLRIVTSGGRVLLDSIGSRFNQPENRYNRPTWYVFTWIRSASLRNALYEGFRDETLWIELWRVGASAPGTRIRLHTEDAGVRAMAICL
jgi:hypothetical protein